MGSSQWIHIRTHRVLLNSPQDSGSGLQWIHIWADPYPFGGTMLMLVLDAFIYLALAWYLDKVRS